MLLRSSTAVALLLSSAMVLTACSSDKADSSSAEPNATAAAAKKKANASNRSVPPTELPKAPVAFTDLLYAERKAVLDAFGTPEEDDYKESGQDSWEIGPLSLMIRYQRGRVAKVALMSSDPGVSATMLRKWAQVGDKKSLKSDGGLSWSVESDDDAGFGDKHFVDLWLISDMIPQWRPNVKKLLGKREAQVKKELSKAATTPDESTWFITEDDLTIHVSYSAEDGVVQTLSFDMGEGVDTPSMPERIYNWAKVSPEGGEQRINGVRYGIQLTGHSLFFQRYHGRYSKRELEAMRR